MDLLELRNKINSQPSGLHVVITKKWSRDPICTSSTKGRDVQGWKTLEGRRVGILVYKEYGIR